MMDDSAMFSVNQAITVSAASNYAGCGFGVAGPGVYDTGAEGSLGQAVKKFIFRATVGIPFVGPANATLVFSLQGGNDLIAWAILNIGDYYPFTLPTLQIPGQILCDSPLANIGGALSATTPPRLMPRYMRINYWVANGPFTAGTVNAGLDMY
jgi:hypothetical protein